MPATARNRPKSRGEFRKKKRTRRPGRRDALEAGDRRGPKTGSAEEPAGRGAEGGCGLDLDNRDYKELISEAILSFGSTGWSELDPVFREVGSNAAECSVE
jgi:hypothetical protein